MILSLAALIYSFVEGFDDWIKVYRPTLGAILAGVACAGVFLFISRRTSSLLARIFFYITSAGFAVLSATGLLLSTSFENVALIAIVAFLAWVVVLTSMLCAGLMTYRETNKNQE
jgi:predicted membrane channel-forming protein YqfA (hemolysin III family)